MESKGSNKTKSIKSFTDLIVWQEAHILRIKILKEIRKFPQCYQYGLSGQLQRSAISVGSNIAEGFGRRTLADKRRFYDIARGSLTEVQDQLLVARDIGVIDQNKLKLLANKSVEVHQLLNGFIRSLKKSQSLGIKSNDEAPSHPIQTPSSKIQATPEEPHR